jgi:hypothetical protein
MVAPKRAALAEANRKLDSASRKLAAIRARVRELQERVAVLEGGLMKARAARRTPPPGPRRRPPPAARPRCRALRARAGDRGQERGHGAGGAHRRQGPPRRPPDQRPGRRVPALDGDHQAVHAGGGCARAAAPANPKQAPQGGAPRAARAPAGKLVGNTLLAAAFVSYAGPFSIPFRRALVQDKWLPDLHERAIPLSAGIAPLDILTSDAAKARAAAPAARAAARASGPVERGGTRGRQARWAQEGLQTDTLSVENGAIMTAASRWSLLIDPQLQGIQWIIRREQPAGLVITQQSAPHYIEQAAPGPRAKG